MKRRLWLYPVLIAAAACHFRDVATDPAAPGLHSQLSIGFSFRGTQGKASGKIIWKTQADRTVIYLLDPVNRLVGVAYARTEEVVLVNRKKRLHWSGDFRELLNHYWDLDLTLDELRFLVWEGRIPEQPQDQGQIAFKVKRKGNKVTKISIQQPAEEITLRIGKRETRTGGLREAGDLSGLKPASLDEIFADD